MTPAEILAARKRLGLTQKQMAEAVGLGKDGRRIVRAWEKGEYTPSGRSQKVIELMLERAQKETER